MDLHAISWRVSTLNGVYLACNINLSVQATFRKGSYVQRHCIAIDKKGYTNSALPESSSSARVCLYENIGRRCEAEHAYEKRAEIDQMSRLPSDIFNRAEIR